MFEINMRQAASASSFPEIVRRSLCVMFDYSTVRPGLVQVLTLDTKALSSERDSVRRKDERLRVFCDQWKKMGKVIENISTPLIAYLMGGVLIHGNIYLSNHPEKREQIIEQALLFILRAISKE